MGHSKTHNKFFYFPNCIILLISFRSSMQEQNCVTCSKPFDYYKKVATVVCSQNHVVCKECSQILYSTNSKCPHCLGQLIHKQRPNPYYQNQNPISSNQNIPKPQINPYARNPPPHQNHMQNNYGNNPGNNYGNNPGNNYGNNYGNNQANTWNQGPQQNQHPYRNDPQINVVNHEVNGGFCFDRRKLSLLFFFIFIGFSISLYFSVATNSCSFYGRYSCYYPQILDYQCCQYLCPTYWYDSSCKSFVELQGPFIVFYVTTSIFGVLMVILLIRMCMVNRRNRNNVNVYVRQ